MKEICWHSFFMPFTIFTTFMFAFLMGVLSIWKPDDDVLQRDFHLAGLGRRQRRPGDGARFDRGDAALNLECRQREGIPSPPSGESASLR